MIEALIAYLKTAVPVLEVVAHAWELENIIEDDVAVPAAYVYLKNERTHRDGTDYQISKRLLNQVHIRLVLPVARLTEIKTLVRKAVIGWNPNPAEGWDDMEFMSAEMITISVGLAYWDEVYTSWLTLRTAY